MKYKNILFLFSVLIFIILFGSCKTCDCPAYSQNSTQYIELEAEKNNIYRNDTLFASRDQVQNNGLTN